MEAIDDSPQHSISGARRCVAPNPAMHADRRSIFHVPLARVMAAKRFIGEHARGTDFSKIAAERIFQNSVLGSPEIDGIMNCEDIEIAPSGVIPIIADAPVALDAAIHFMIEERPQILVPVGSLLESASAIVMACHHSHILKMAFASFIADRAIMRVIEHEPFNHACPESLCFGIIDGDPHAVSHRGHAGHYDFAFSVFLVSELLYGALPARAYGTERRVPAEVGNIESQGQALMEQVLLAIDLVRLIIYVNRVIGYLQRQRALRTWSSKSLRKYFNALCSGSTAPGARAQNVIPGPRSAQCCERISKSSSVPVPSSIAASIF